MVLKAGELFREYGFDGIGIADLMKAAGLTHGGFYGQFKSKVDPAAEASRQALALNAATWRETINRTREKALKAIAGMYLSRPNLIFKAKGCTFASLYGDASRQGEAVQSVFADGIENHLQLLHEIVVGNGDEDRRRKSIVILSQMVGGLTLARAVGNVPLAEEILAALRDELETRH